jgi:hypothetical protein
MTLSPFDLILTFEFLFVGGPVHHEHPISVMISRFADPSIPPPWT